MSFGLLKLPKYETKAEFGSKDIKSGAVNGHLITKGISSSAFQRVWKEGLTGKGIIVAVVDTGVDNNHPDLANKIVNSINLTGEPLTENHGTHVAGTIAANGWLVGGAYDCKILDIKVIGKNGGSIYNIAKAIGLAVANGATIVNMSLGGSGLSQSDINMLNTTIQDAWNKGVICVCASGNSGTSVGTADPYEYPASIDKSESVAACDVDSSLNKINLAYFSNENNKVDLSACGVNVTSCVFGGNYGILSGTSMATPHVSAMAACLAQSIKQKYPSLTGSSFASALVSLLNSQTLLMNGASNISYGMGYLRYEPNKGPEVPNGTVFTYSNIFLGHLIN